MTGPLCLNFRRLLLVKGTGSTHFLQGLITKDMESLNDTRLIYTFLLNVKGRILSDLFIWRLENDADEAFALETDSTRLEAVHKALKLYKLRRPIQIEPIREKRVHFCDHFESSTTSSSTWQPDPRVPGFGFRSIQAENGGQNDDERADRLAYLRRRLHWGIAEGEEMVEQIPLNMNGDLMNGISFDKGCYIGQELVARTYHTGLVRRRLMPFKWVEPVQETAGAGDDPDPVDLVLRDEKGRKQGKLICSHGELGGLCLASLEAVPPDKPVQLFSAAGKALEVHRPSWWP